MSCFVMKAEAISKIANYTEALLNMGYNFFGMEAPDSLYMALSDCRDYAGFYDSKLIYKRLLSLNLAAYSGRYGRDSDLQELDGYKSISAFSRPVYCYHYKIDRWMLEMSKRLSCYNYQCAEDATRKDDLHLAMRELEKCLNYFIVQNMAAWQTSKWGE